MGEKTIADIREFLSGIMVHFAALVSTGAVSCHKIKAAKAAQ